MSENIDEIKKNDLIKGLNQLGISKKEAVVYIALLRLGEVGSSKIEYDSGLHRQFIYNALYSLEKKGLIKHIIFNGRKKWSAQPPRRIQGLIDEKRRIAENLVDKMDLLFKKGEEQNFELFKGDQAFINHQFQIILDAEEGETLSILQGTWNKFFEVMGKEIDRYEKLRISKKISIHYIGSDEHIEELIKTKLDRKLFDYRVIKGLSEGSMDTSIWKNGIAINLFGQPVISFVLKNPEVAKGQQEFFDSLWKMGIK